jgi:hypothetical protein
MKPATLETSHPTSSMFLHYSGAHHFLGNPRRPMHSFQSHLISSISSIPKNSLIMILPSPGAKARIPISSHVTCLSLTKQHYASKVKTISLSLQTLLHQHHARRAAVDVSSSLEPRSRIRFQDTLEILEYFVLYEVSILNGMVSLSRGSNALLRGYIALVLGFLLHLGRLGL